MSLVREEPLRAEVVPYPNVPENHRSHALEIPAAGAPVLAWLARDIAPSTSIEGPEPMRAHALPYSPADAPEGTIWVHVQSESHALHLAFSTECLEMLPPGTQANGRLIIPIPPPPEESGEWLHRLRPPMPALFRDHLDENQRTWDVVIDLSEESCALRFIGASANTGAEGVEFDGVLGELSADGQFAVALSPTGNDSSGRFEAELVADPRDAILWAIRMRAVAED
jgi:hypothetical protein